MKLQRIQGTIEVLGQSEFDNVGTAYGYIRFADANGKVTMHDNIIVLNNCNSYLKPGLSGVFYLSRFCRGQILYGLRIPGRIAEDTKLAGQIRTSLLFKVYWPLVLGLLGIFIIIGFIPLMQALRYIVDYFQAPKAVQMREFMALDDGMNLLSEHDRQQAVATPR